MAKTHLREHFLEIGLEIIDLFQHFVKNMMTMSFMISSLPALSIFNERGNYRREETTKNIRSKTVTY